MSFLDRPGIPGRSPDKWPPDTELRAEWLNRREQRYGGDYFDTAIGLEVPGPIFTPSVGGNLWGQPTYGFAAYNPVLGVSLFETTVDFDEDSPVLAQSDAYAQYSISAPHQYGFLTYGNSEFGFSDTQSLDEDPPVMNFGPGSQPYGTVGQSYGFGSYGFQNRIEDIVPFDDSAAPSFTSHDMSVRKKYGNNAKWGFWTWQAP